MFALVADGRLHVTAVVMLTPCLTPANAADLLAAAAHQSRAGLEQSLAERFPRPDLPERIAGFVLSPAGRQLAPEPVGSANGRLAPEPVGPPSRQCVAPLAPGRYGLQFTVAQGTYERLRCARALLGHAVPAGESAQAFDLALDALSVRLERRCRRTACPDLSVRKAASRMPP